MAFGVSVLFVHKVDGGFPVHLDDDVVADGSDFLSEPLIGFNQHLLYRDKVVKTAGLDRVAMSAVDLGFIALGKAGSELSAEILAAVAVIVDLGLDPVDEVFIIAALAEKMAG